MILDDTDRLVLPDNEEDTRDGQSDLTPDQDSPVVDSPKPIVLVRVTRRIAQQMTLWM